MSKLLASPVAALGGLLAVLLIGLGLYGWGRHDGRALEQGRSAVAAAKAEERIAALYHCDSWRLYRRQHLPESEGPTITLARKGAR